MCHKKNKHKKEFQGMDILNDETVAASTDMTGLVQKPPSDEAEAESYENLANVSMPNTPNRTK